ncbi:hypothetical protein [Actinoallomurus iriomotensis]|uniref:Uncharacterized protein n=1 Tax=Actinoallomurus iriomotensis TaxID=478107 RepID=A0A9W6RI96_9ACTN|nr:hypothetical protein [Actinoallomurus iriomotensis]GLY74537.1 hypothetical protein Airi01_028040 [Actinoallomurus iriomotensis]
MAIGQQFVKGSLGVLDCTRQLFRSPEASLRILERGEKPRIRVGVVGYSGQRFDEDAARELLRKAYAAVRKDYPDQDLTVVSGLTKLGIPKIAYEEAGEHWLAEGVASGQAIDFPWSTVDRIRIVGDNWGDESDTFVHGIDVLIRIGGGEQTRAEVLAVKRLGKPVYEHRLPTLEASADS